MRAQSVSAAERTAQPLGPLERGEAAMDQQGIQTDVAHMNLPPMTATVLR